MKPTRPTHIPNKTMQRMDKMIDERRSISEISRVLRIPEWIVADIVQKRFIQEKIEAGEEL